MHLLQYDLNQLVVLRALLETSSVQESARRVGRSPTAVSHTLARLREQFDDPLLVRAGQRLVPTPFALELRLPLASALQGLSDVIQPRTTFDPRTATGTLRVAAADVVQATLFATVSEQVARLAPGVSLHAVPHSFGSIDRLRDGDVHVSIGVYPRLPPDIEQSFLPVEHFVTLLRAGHPALDQPWTLDAYVALEHILVALRGTSHGAIDTLLADLGHTRRVVRLVSSFLAAPALVRSSDLVVTLPSSVQQCLEPGAFVARVPPEPLSTQIQMSMIWHRHRSNHDLLVFVRSLFEEAARAVGPHLSPR